MQLDPHEFPPVFEEDEGGPFPCGCLIAVIFLLLVLAVTVLLVVRFP